MAANTNAQQRIPPLFQEIIKVDRERVASGNVIDIERALRRRVLVKAAEVALSWNTNKGEAK